MAKFKVGDRVRLVKDGKSTTGAVGKTATLVAWGGGTFVDNGEYLLDIDPPFDFTTLAVTPNFTRAKPDCFELIPSTLTIEAGRYYKTRDGRKVGPMESWRYGVWSSHKDCSFKGGLWSDNGTAWFAGAKDSPDLIAEWVDPQAEPAPEPVTGKATLGENTAREPWPLTSADGCMSIKDGVFTLKFSQLQLPSLSNPAIVALIENDKAKPSAVPKLHPSRDAALKEADRLAGKYLGQVFGVFTLDTKRVAQVRNAA